MTELCQLEGRARKWQLAYFRPKVVSFGQIFAKNWAKNFLEAQIKNLSPLVSQEFSPLTATKTIIGKYLL